MVLRSSGPDALVVVIQFVIPLSGFQHAISLRRSYWHFKQWSRLTIWFDGVQVFDQSGIPTMPSSLIEWDVGGVTEAIVPDPATMFIDDACVSTRRLGPSFPVFSRGE